MPASLNAAINWLRAARASESTVEPPVGALTAEGIFQPEV